MLNNKGMSPLILTIILIALAVAIGAMIMSWGSSKTQIGDGTCDEVNLIVQKAFDSDLICYNDVTEKLKVVIKNAGKNEISSVTYRIINPDLTIRDITLPASEMKPGRIYQAEIPFQQGERIHIELVPNIMTGETPMMCDAKAIIKETIISCKT